MTKQTEAMKLALEALEYQSKPLCMCFAGCENCDPANVPDPRQAITALREALAEQPAQRLSDEDIERAIGYRLPKHSMGALRKLMAGQPAQQEPIWFWTHPTHGRLYKQPPAQRPWVGLTDEEIDEATAYANPHCDEFDFARAIETKLREKNS